MCCPLFFRKSKILLIPDIFMKLMERSFNLDVEYGLVRFGKKIPFTLSALNLTSCNFIEYSHLTCSFFGSFQCLLSAVSLQDWHIARIRSAVILLRRHAILSLRTVKCPVYQLPVTSVSQCLVFVEYSARKSIFWKHQKISSILIVAFSTFKAILFRLRWFTAGVGSKPCPSTTKEIVRQGQQ